MTLMMAKVTPNKGGAMKTQTDQILEHLKKAPITPLEALNLYGCFRLGARIFDLKEQGHTITKTMVTKGRKSFAKYFLGGQARWC